MKNISHSRRAARNQLEIEKTNDDDTGENNVENYESDLRVPERKQTAHPGYHVVDDTECKFNSQDSKIVFTSNKDSYIYKISALERAKRVSYLF